MLAWNLGAKKRQWCVLILWPSCCRFRHRDLNKFDILVNDISLFFQSISGTPHRIGMHDEYWSCSSCSAEQICYWLRRREIEGLELQKKKLTIFNVQRQINSVLYLHTCKSLMMASWQTHVWVCLQMNVCVKAQSNTRWATHCRMLWRTNCALEIMLFLSLGKILEHKRGHMSLPLKWTL